jgi:hypothetical protein
VPEFLSPFLAVVPPQPQPRICCHCNQLFLPDWRNRFRQRFCNQPACRQASKRHSHQQWRKKNPDYFRGEEHVKRVQQWRQAHPGYGKRPPPEPPPPLQEVLPSNPIDPQPLAPQPSTSRPGSLQDSCPPLQDFLSRNPLLTGMIAHVFDCALQEDIEHTARRLIVKGLDILGTTPGTQNETQSSDYDAQKTPSSRTPAPGPQPI